MLTKGRVIQLLIMLCVLISLFVWRTIGSSPSETEKQPINDDILVVEEPLCDFTQPCIFNTLWGDFSLSVDEGKIMPEQWFHLTLKSQLENWKVISAKTVGKTMFMGKIPMRFSPVTENLARYESKTKSMLGACTEDKMIWRFDIVVEVEGQPINLHYDFLIVH